MVRAGDAALPFAGASPRPHAIGDVLAYSLHGTLSQQIRGHDPFGRSIRQDGVPTVLQGRERIAIKAVDDRGLSLHRSGTISATFNGHSPVAQTGAGWTLVTPEGSVRDRKGSTLGGLFLLPLGFLGERAVDNGAIPVVGTAWTNKLGMALFGMTAQPMLHYQVTGTRSIFGTVVLTLVGNGTAPVKEPVVSNDGIALGDAIGITHVTLRCDFDPLTRRAIAMDISLHGDLRIRGGHGRGTGVVADRQHILVALDASSINATDPPH